MIESVFGGELILTHKSTSVNGYYLKPDSAVPGSVWFDGQTMKVYTGTGWEKIQGDGVYITESARLLEVVSWAENKMNEERRESELREKFPALKQAKDNYDLIRNMVTG